VKPSWPAFKTSAHFWVVHILVAGKVFRMGSVIARALDIVMTRKG